MAAGSTGHRARFGSVRKLPSGRWQARYTAGGLRHTAGQTFETKQDAYGWLRDEERAVDRGTWQPPGAPAAAAPVTFAEYAASWMADRELAARTREDYDYLLRLHLLPVFGPRPLAAITVQEVSRWYARLAGLTRKGSLRAHAYALLSSIMNTAVDHELRPGPSPCRVRGGQAAKHARWQGEPATLAELEAITAAMPGRYRAMVLLAAWCGLRFGEVTELRRADIDLRGGMVRISRAVTHTRRGGPVVKPPKSAAGIRSVAMPPHIIPVVREHLARHTGPGRDALLFPSPRDAGRHLPVKTLHLYFSRARDAAGRPQLRFHDLRHTGLTLTAQHGATLAELMRRAGHSDVRSVMIYQHAAQERDQALAAAMSKTVRAGNVVPLRQPRRGRGRTAASGS